MAEGVDYAWARPDPRCLFNNSKRFAVRYVGPNTNSGKWLREPEKNALLAAGLKIALVYQTTANFMLQGRSRGEQAGREALAMANGLGITGRPVYHALDTDPRSLSTAEWNAVKGYLDGAAWVMGRSRVGVYGGHKAIEVLCPTWAPFGWQTYAWSGGQLSNKAQLYQYRNGVNLCGGELDLCRSLAPDYGQWPIQTVEEDMPLTDAEIDKVANASAAKVWDRLIDLDPQVAGTNHRAWVVLRDARNLAGRAVAAADVDEAAIAQAVVAALPGGSVDAAVVKEAVKQALREGTA